VTPFPPEGSTADDLEPLGRVTTPETASQPATDDLRAPRPLDRARALAELIDPRAFQGEWASEETKREHQDRALHFAIKVIDLDWHPSVPASPDATAALVDLIRGDYPDVWSVPLPQHAEQIAEAVVKAGFRRVAEDEATVERVARAIWVSRLAPGVVPNDEAWEWRKTYSMEQHDWARAAVRALREET
jgi:RecB family exonuclease